MALIDEVKKRASQARFEADRSMRANRVKRRIGGLQEQVSAVAMALGRRVFDLHQRGALETSKLMDVLNQMNGLASQVSEAERELQAIQAEAFVYDLPGPRCSSCGSINDPGARYCLRCGAPLGAHQDTGVTQPGPLPDQQTPGPAIACAACGASNPASMRFCQTCGSALATSPAAAHPEPAPPADNSAPGYAAEQPVQSAAPPAVEAAPASPPDSEPAASGAEDSGNATVSAATEAGTANGPTAGLEIDGLTDTAAVNSATPGDAPAAAPTEAAVAGPASVEAHCTACGGTIQAAASFCAFCGCPVGPKA